MDSTRRLLDELRMDALQSYGELSQPYDAGLQELVTFASEICETPISLVSVVGQERQRFLAELGFGRASTSREESFCAHAMLHEGVFEVSDATKDARFRSNPLVVGPSTVRFYSGVAIKDRDGIPLGSFCVIDTKPRELSALQRRTLVLLGRQAEARLENLRSLTALREERIARARASVERERLIVEIETERARFRTLLDHSPAFAALLCGEELVYEFANDAHDALLGSRSPLGKPFREVVPEAVEQGVVALLLGVLRTGQPHRASQMPFKVRRDRKETLRHLDVLFQPYLDGHGSICGVFAQGVDVTDCVQAQAALASSGRR